MRPTVPISHRDPEGLQWKRFVERRRLSVGEQQEAALRELVERGDPEGAAEQLGRIRGRRERLSRRRTSAMRDSIEEVEIARFVSRLVHGRPLIHPIQVKVNLLDQLSETSWACPIQILVLPTVEPGAVADLIADRYRKARRRLLGSSRGAVSIRPLVVAYLVDKLEGTRAGRPNWPERLMRWNEAAPRCWHFEGWRDMRDEYRRVAEMPPKIMDDLGNWYREIDGALVPAFGLRAEARRPRVPVATGGSGRRRNSRPTPPP